MQAASAISHTHGHTPGRDQPMRQRERGPGGGSMGARWQRLPLLWLLGPLLWLQARHVRRVTPHMPEPPGLRAGTAGRGPLIRLLVAGDSGAAGVGPPRRTTRCAANSCGA